MSKQQFTVHPGSLLALDPKAYGQEFDCVAAAAIDTNNPAVSVIQISGPLSYGSAVWFCYGNIKSMVQAAAQATAPVICLRIHSPGGDLYGAFDCARDIRKIANDAGKKLVVHVEAQCASAAYALASAADRIVISSTAQVGSIGVICSYVTAIEAAAKEGLTFTLITSGAHKGDGNPHLPIDEPMHARLQSTVDAAAGEFFKLVSELRSGLTPSAISNLQAACLMGQDAVTAGLADEVMPWSAYLALLSAGAIQSETSIAAGKESNMSDRDDIRARLSKQAESDDPVEAKRAKKALAAYDESEDAKAEDDKEEKPEAKAEDDSEKPGDSEEKPEAISAALSTTAAQLQAANTRIAALEARNAKTEMDALLASRPDVCADLKATLRTLPIAKAAEVLKGIKTGPVSPEAIQVTGTQGATSNAGLLDPEARKAAAAALPAHIQSAFGLSAQQAQPTMVGTRLFVDAPATEVK